MVNANLNELELHTGTVEGNRDVEAHFAFPMFWAPGNASTAVLCVELEPARPDPVTSTYPRSPARGAGRGEVEIEIGDERGVFGAGGVVLVPSMVPQAFRDVGESRARIVGFFSSNTVAAIADEVVQPIGSRVIGSPSPELAGAV